MVARRTFVFVACELVGNEVVVGEVFVEGANEPVAVSRELAMEVFVHPIRVPKSHKICPVTSHVFAIRGICEQSVHWLFHRRWSCGLLKTYLFPGCLEEDLSGQNSACE